MNDPASSPKNSRWKAALILAFVFMLGAGCGIGGGLLVLRRVVRHAMTSPGGQKTPVDYIAVSLEREMTSKLKLTDEERAQVHDDLEKAADEFKKLRADTLQKTKDKARDSLDRIAGHLPPEKAASLRELAAKKLKPWGLLD